MQNAWTRYTVSGVAPAGAAFASVGVNRKNPYAATWWLDGKQFEVGTAASAFRASPASEFRAGPATDFNFGLATVYFHYDGINVVAETSSSDTVSAAHLYDDYGGLVSMTRGGQTYFYQTNGHGDVVSLTNAAGAVVNTYTYVPGGRCSRPQSRS